MGGSTRIFARKFQMIKHMPKRVTEVLFCIAFYLFSTDMWFIALEHYSIDALTVKLLSISVKIIVGLLLILKLMTQRFTLRHVLIIAVAALIVAYSAHCSTNNGILWAFLFIIACQDVQWSDIGYTQLSVIISTIIIDIVLAVTGIGSDVIRYTPRRGIRYSLGFTHPNTAALFVVLILLAIFLLVRKMQWTIAIFPVAVAAFNEVLFDARGSVLSLVMLSVMLLFLCGNTKSRDQFQRIVSATICVITDMLAASSIIGMVLYRANNRFWSMANWVYSGRLSLLHAYFESGLSLFGRHYSNAAQTIYDSHGEEMTFIADNLYANLILQEGLILGSSLLLLLLVVQWMIRRNFDIIFVGFSYFLLLGFSEASGLSISYNWFLLVIGLLFYGSIKYPQTDAKRSRRKSSVAAFSSRASHVPQHVRSLRRRGKHTATQNSGRRNAVGV